jgi:hypothetical protein
MAVVLSLSLSLSQFLWGSSGVLENLQPCYLGFKLGQLYCVRSDVVVEEARSEGAQED